MPAMIRIRRLWIVSTLLALGCGLTACSPSVSQSDQQDEKNPYFQKAKRRYQERDYKEAVKYYQRALEMDPHNGAAHLELGLLYEDKLQDYSYAIYHYRRYLELRPQAEKADLVKQFVDRAQLALAASVPNSPLVTGEEIARLRQENSNLLRQVEVLMATNQVLEMRLAKSENTPGETVAPVIVQTNVFVVPTVTNRIQAAAVRTPLTNQTPPVPVARTQDAAPAVRTYIVQKGDNLTVISRKMYGRPDKVQLIYSANKNIIGPPPSYRLKVGLKLTIPRG